MADRRCSLITGEDGDATLYLEDGRTFRVKLLAWNITQADYPGSAPLLSAVVEESTISEPRQDVTNAPDHKRTR